jgi:hypothetical protein
LKLERKLSITVDGNGVQQQAYTQAMNYLYSHVNMGDVINAMNTMSVKIDFNYSGNDQFDSVTNTIHWDPTSALNVIQPNGQIGAQSPALGLLHEIYHWLYYHTGNPAYAEEATTYLEANAAAQLGEPARPTYSSVNQINKLVVVTNPTAHTGGGYWQAVDMNGNPVQGPVYDPNATVVSVPGGANGTPPSNGGGSTGGNGDSTAPGGGSSPGGGGLSTGGGVIIGGGGGGSISCPLCHWKPMSEVPPATLDSLNAHLADIPTDTYVTSANVDSQNVQLIGISDHVQTMPVA